MNDLEAARRWLRQAEADLVTARDNSFTHPYAACFFAQQAAEKGIKGVHLALTGMLARTHSLSRLYALVDELRARLERRPMAELDRLYTQTRYPDALPDVIPAEHFLPEDAETAISQAEQALAAARSLIGDAATAAEAPDSSGPPD